MQGKPTATAHGNSHGHTSKRRATCTAAPGGTVQNGAKCTSLLFLLLRALLDGVCFHFFKHTPSQNSIEYLYLTLNQPPTAPLSHFPQSQTNLIPKPFFAHNSFPIHHHFHPLTPHSHLFSAHSISFQPHSFYP